MPATSKAQQRLMGLVKAVQAGDVPKGKVTKKIRQLAKSMKEKDVDKYAGTKHKGLPNKVKSESLKVDVARKYGPKGFIIMLNRFGNTATKIFKDKKDFDKLNLNLNNQRDLAKLLYLKTDRVGFVRENGRAIMKSISNAKKGAVAKGGGYAPFVKMGNNSWKQPKTNTKTHDDGIFDKIGGFKDFIIERKFNHKKLGDSYLGGFNSPKGDTEMFADKKGRYYIWIKPKGKKAKYVDLPNNIRSRSQADNFHDKINKSLGEIVEACWSGYKQVGMKKGKKGKQVPNCVPEVAEHCGCEHKDTYDVFSEETGIGYTLSFCTDKKLKEAEYQGRKVKLNKPMQGDVGKFKVYVKNDKGNVVKVNFGAKGSENRIKKSDPARRKSFRARHNCDNPGPKHKARYWSCRKW